MKEFWHFIGNENGLETVEYAIVLGLVVAGSIGLLLTLGSWVQTQFRSAASPGGP